MSHHIRTSLNGVAIYPAGQHPRDLRKAAKPVNVTLPEVVAEAKADKPKRTRNSKKSK